MKSQIKLNEIKRAAGVFMVVFGFGALLNAACAIWFATGYYDQNGHAAELLPHALLITLFATQNFIETWMFHKNVGNPNYSAKRHLAQVLARLFTLLSILFLAYAAFAVSGNALMMGVLHIAMAAAWWSTAARTKPNQLSPLPAHLANAVAIDIGSGKVYVEQALASDNGLLDWIAHNQANRTLTLVPCQVETIAAFPAIGSGKKFIRPVLLGVALGGLLCAAAWMYQKTGYMLGLFVVVPVCLTVLIAKSKMAKR